MIARFCPKRLGAGLLALAGLTSFTTLDAYLPAHTATPAEQASVSPTLLARSPRALIPPPRPIDPAFAALPAVSVTNVNTRARAILRLYDATGALDPRALEALDELLADHRDPREVARTPIDRRALKLLFKAAYDFGKTEIELVSGYRKPGRRREGLHGQGRAIDFRLPGVKATELAAYLRKLPRAGVGVYTHPRTQFVHLDVREQSYHWLDASPPKRRWRERSLGRISKEHDRYEPEMDLPEAVRKSRAHRLSGDPSLAKIVSM